MIIRTPLQGSLVRRYKRFLADIQAGDQIQTVHCPNTGSMKSLLDRPSTAWCSHSENPARKLSHTLELLEYQDGSLACVNTHRANQLAEEALSAGLDFLPPLQSLRREVKYGLENSRADFWGKTKENQEIWIEVKNVTLAWPEKQGLGEFPDAVTIRGTRHLRELMHKKEEGHRALLLFLINRSDIERFSPATDIDPEYAKTLERAQEHGVEICCVKTRFQKNEDHQSWTLSPLERIPFYQ
jgi:sugar fermentation stimulation protein A